MNELNVFLFIQMSTSAALQCYKLQVEKVTRIANSLTVFTNLIKSDQNALLKVC